MSLKLEHSIVINATPDVVWRVFENIENWSRWDPQAIKSVRWVSGDPWTKGAKFEISLTKPMPFTLTPELIEVQPPVFVHLKGRGSGVTGEQVYVLKYDRGTDSTELRTIQEFSGMPITLFGERARQPVLDGIAHMFGRVKQEAEELARAGQSHDSSNV